MELQSSIDEAGVKVQQSETSRALNMTGMYKRADRKKPLLKEKHIKAHLEFARKYDLAKMWEDGL